jgi:hypothetical protein
MLLIDYRIVVLIIGVFYYYVRRSLYQRHERIEYKPLGASEFEMSFGATERRKKYRETEFNDNSLVDYEIKPLKEKKATFNNEI